MRRIPVYLPAFHLPGIIVIGLLGMLIAPVGDAIAQDSDQPAVVTQSLETSNLIILSGAEVQRFTVELADEPAERSQGLMFRRSMDADHGMLFLFDRPQRVTMWMKNTFISLDILFLQQDGVIVNIAHDTEPESLSQIVSKGRVLGVLELSAGTTERLEIKPGDQVLHAIFGNAPRHKNEPQGRNEPGGG